MWGAETGLWLGEGPPSTADPTATGSAQIQVRKTAADETAPPHRQQTAA